ncbi:chaperone protein DnaJ [Abditibacteriota bacterium]|nr:chaperone protein DnaJ [Abditibacteriota bacterium]
MNPEADPYTILGVPRDCNADELKSAYRRLARENHPDIAHDKSAATLRMTQINAAWALIGDPQKRAGFDARWRFDERERQRLAAQRFAQQRSTPKPKPAPPSPNPSKAKTGRPAPAHPPGPGRPAPAKATPASPANPKASSKRSAASPASRHARLAEASNLLFKQNKPNEALEMCKWILKTDFRNIPARELMGEAYLRLGQTDRALAVWEQALVLAPANVTLRRRWLSLMPPETRAVHERKGTPTAQAVPRATVVSHSMTKSAPTPNLLSRLVSRLKKK